MREKLGRVFYGWWIVAAGSVLCAFGYGAWFYSYGAFFTPISTEFGWSRALTSLAYSFNRLEGGIEGLITGPIIDRFGPRFMIRISWTMTALGFLLMSQINSFWMFVVSYTVLVSLGMNGGLYMPMQTSITKWFDEKKGLALGILTASAAIGGSIVLQGTAWLINDYGWRKAVIVMAIVAVVLGWGASFIVKPHGPERYGLRVDGKRVEPGEDVSESASIGTEEEVIGVSGGISLKEAMKTRSFWIMTIAFLCSHASMTGVVVHEIPFIEDMGVSPGFGSGGSGCYDAYEFPGQVGGWLVCG